MAECSTEAQECLIPTNVRLHDLNANICSGCCGTKDQGIKTM